MIRLLSARLLIIVICASFEFGCDQGSSVSQEDQSQGDKRLSPLTAAAKKGDLSAVKRLLSNGVDPNAADGDGRMPLQYAAASGNLEVVQGLLGAGANVRACSADGYTALHAAAVEREASIVKLLLAAGADVNARTKNDSTPLWCAIGSPYSSSEVSLLLIRAGADINDVGSDGATPLWYAVTDKSLEVVEELLKRGADPNVQPTGKVTGGDTPLHGAVLNGLIAEVELLLRYGANPSIRNAAGQTPLDVANKKFPEIRQILAKYSNDSG